MAEEKLTRIAIVNQDKCKPKKCRQECKRNCPVVRMGIDSFLIKSMDGIFVIFLQISTLGKLCIEVTPESKVALINEQLCIGCGLCVKKCPYGAINIINLPKNINKDTTHR
jgi:ATP-binding cassette subfamily E protein 1